MTEEVKPCISFEEALAKANKFAEEYPDFKDKNLLIGNGFSIDAGCDFSYKKLLEQANFDLTINKIFNEFDTKDFEQVIDKISEAKKVIKCYEAGFDLANALEEDVEIVRTKLTETIHENHPEGTGFLGEAKVFSCLNFLSNFQKLYTTNYDLILYWVLCTRDDYVGLFKDDTIIKQFDGFAPQLGSLIWDIDRALDNDTKQNVFYLHGALHLFDSGSSTHKLRKIDNCGLLDIIKTHLEKNRLPMVVAEGKSKAKVDKIAGNNYLKFCFQSLERTKGCFFIHGHSIDKNDKHLFHKIRDNQNIRQIYVSVHNPDENYDTIYEKVSSIFGTRERKNSLKIEYYDATTTNTWTNITDSDIHKKRYFLAYDENFLEEIKKICEKKD